MPRFPRFQKVRPDHLSACPVQRLGRMSSQYAARNRDTVKEHEADFEDSAGGGRGIGLLSEMSGGPRFYDENHFVRLHPKCDRWESFSKCVRAQEDNLHRRAPTEGSLPMRIDLSESNPCSFEEAAIPSPCSSAKQLGPEDTFATCTMGTQPMMAEVPKHASLLPGLYARHTSKIQEGSGQDDARNSTASSSGCSSCQESPSMC